MNYNRVFIRGDTHGDFLGFPHDRENIDYNPTHSGQGNVSMLFNKIVR